MAEDQILHADVLVQLLPVNTSPTSDQSPVLPFLGRPVAQTRIPGKWSRNRATIGKFRDQKIVGNSQCRHADVLDVNR